MEHLLTLPGKKYLPIIQRLEEIARRTRLTPSQRREYDKALDAYMVEEDAMRTAIQEGRDAGRKEGLEKGRAEGQAEERMKLIRSMHANGMSADAIAACTGLELQAIREVLG